MPQTYEVFCVECGNVLLVRMQRPDGEHGVTFTDTQWERAKKRADTLYVCENCTPPNRAPPWWPHGWWAWPPDDTPPPFWPDDLDWPPTEPSVLGELRGRLRKAQPRP